MTAQAGRSRNGGGASVPRTGGRLLVLSGPSGVGKTTVSTRLLETPGVHPSVSATTRPRRTGERDGVDYHFLSEEAFRSRIAAGAFLEWAEVHGYLYGTPRAPVDDVLRRGEIALLEIDVQGAAKLRAAGVPAVYVFLAPPSWEDLEARLRGRATEGEDVVLRRLENARREMEAMPLYDHVVVNDAVEHAVDAIQELLALEAGGDRTRGGDGVDGEGADGPK